MRVEDESQNPRILSLTRLMAALKQSRSPIETLTAIRQGFGEVYGSLASMMIWTRDLRKDEFRLIQLRKEGEYSAGGNDPWLMDEFPLYRGGVVPMIISTPGPHIVNDVDWSVDPHFAGALEGYNSVIAIPFDGQRLPMSWTFLLKRTPPNFTTVELEQSVLRTVLVGALLESQSLAQELAKANQRIDRDIRQVADLQRLLLPDPLPKIPGLEVAISYEPSGLAGGDLYDFFPLDDDVDGKPRRWCVFVGDASGHGSAAAVVMAIVQTILHAHPPDVAGPGDLLADANEQLCRKKIGGFVTAFLGIYDVQTRRLVYVSAGHLPPLMKSGDGKITRLDAVGSVPLGIDPDESFKTATVQLRPGDSLLLYTDGITESRGADHAMFELERLESEFQDRSDRPEELIAHLLRLVTAHQRGQKPVDDQTMVAMRVV
jgi:phosphoserine phosphatase RsbU/P